MAFAIVLLSLLGIGKQQPVDSCARMFAPRLRRAIERQFPSYRLPLQQDSSREDIQYHLEHGGNGCLAAAQGDFDGDGREDLAFLATDAGNVFLMVGFSGPRMWKVERVWTAGDSTDRPRLFVEAADPGKYDDLGLADEMEPGQVATFTCRSQVVLTGMIEATTVAFCKSEKGWAHVWISD